MATALLNQTLYSWGVVNRLGPTSVEGLWPVASSLSRDATGELRRWHDRVQPWLRGGDHGMPEPSLFYAVFGTEAALIRRSQPAGVWTATAHLLFGSATVLTARLALELRDWTWGAEKLSEWAPVVDPGALMSHRSSLGRSAREARLRPLLTALVSQVLAGPGPVESPASPDTPALLWAVDDICTVLGSGTPDWPQWSVAFETLDERRWQAAPPGLFLRFRRDTPDLTPHPRTVQAAAFLTRTYLRGGTNALRKYRQSEGLLRLPTMAQRVAKLIELSGPALSGREQAVSPSSRSPSSSPGPRSSSSPPGPPGADVPDPESRAFRFTGPGEHAQPPVRTAAAPTGSTTAHPSTASSTGPSSTGPSSTGPFSTIGAFMPPSSPERTVSGGRTPVSCPICLGGLDWGELPLYTYDRGLNQYTELTVPRDANAAQRSRLLRTAAVRCPNPGGTTTSTHYLPAGYGQYGSPAVYGFIGATTSGKTHLVAAMVAAIERGALASYGLTAQPVDLDRHQSFLRDMVRPLFDESTRLSPTREGEVAFVDAFLISGGERPRAMALFDVAGSELSNVGDAKRFLDIADGLVFVADPTRFGPGSLGDPAFNTVLDLLRASGRLPSVSAAIALNKADLFKFDDPIARWLQQDSATLDAAEVLEESADVFAYLHQRDAQAWARPYQECGRATLHVVSATGTDAVERGVRPVRVLRPLVALMAMTGLLTVPEAQDIGI